MFTLSSPSTSVRRTKTRSSRAVGRFCRYNPAAAQFAVTAIDQHSQLYALGASSVRDGFDGGTHGASGVQHIVHDDDGRACNTRIEIGQRSVRARHVIAPRCNVQLEHRRCLAFDLAQLGSNALRQIDTACFHTGEQQVLRALFFSTISNAMRVSARRMPS